MARWSRRTTVAAALAAAVIAFGAVVIAYQLPSIYGSAAPAPATAPEPTPVAATCAEKVRVVFHGKSFCPDDRVVTSKYAGTLKPDETGYPVELRIEPGHTAKVLGNAPSPVTGEPALARVEWDAQVWQDMDGKSVERAAIVDTIHADYLSLAR